MPNAIAYYEHGILDDLVNKCCLNVDQNIFPEKYDISAFECRVDDFPKAFSRKDT